MATGMVKKGRAKSYAPLQRPFFLAKDHGFPVRIPRELFAPVQRGGGWGAFADSFTKLNRIAAEAVDVKIVAEVTPQGFVVDMVPGGRAGAIPLRSAQTGHVVGSFIVEPRFGWTGVGQVLSEIGWHAMPEFLNLPMVPGSGREVPPWVLAGPILERLAALMRRQRKGYREAEAVLEKPRGRILWPTYIKDSLSRGRWHQLPCRFPDLEFDPVLRQYLRWVLEHLYRSLIEIGAGDVLARSLAWQAQHLLGELQAVVPKPPRRADLGRLLDCTSPKDEVFRQALEAMGWVIDGRGLGGGREREGLAWALSLDQLWESYVETVIRREAVVTGGALTVGRLGQTTIRLEWSDTTHKSLGHLVPDMVVRHGRSVQIVDAKYKAHLAELDEVGWREFTAEFRESHRADIHQVLAYSSVYDADEVTATLVYPLRERTWRALRERGKDVSRAEISRGGRRVVVELRGLSFGATTTELQIRPRE